MKTVGQSEIPRKTRFYFNLNNQTAEQLRGFVYIGWKTTTKMSMQGTADNVSTKTRICTWAPPGQ